MKSIIFTSNSRHSSTSCCAVQAQKCGLTKRAFLVRLIEGRPVKARPAQEIKDLRTEIHHIGNNINQIARSSQRRDRQAGGCQTRAVPAGSGL